MEKINNEEQIRSELERQKDIIRALEKEIKKEKDSFEQTHQELELQKQFEEQKNTEALALLDKLHREEVHLKNKEFGIKKAADEQRFSELGASKKSRVTTLATRSVSCTSFRKSNLKTSKLRILWLRSRKTKKFVSLSRRSLNFWLKTRTSAKTLKMKLGTKSIESRSATRMSWPPLLIWESRARAGSPKLPAPTVLKRLRRSS
jgi:hypothetical protein